MWNFCKGVHVVVPCCIVFRPISTRFFLTIVILAYVIYCKRHNPKKMAAVHLTIIVFVQKILYFEIISLKNGH